MKLYWKVALFTAIASAAWGQSSFSSETKIIWDGVKGNILKSAEKMPEENYSFKPTPEVRSFGQILGHGADSYYLFCSAVKGEERQPGEIEKSKTTKGDLIAALKEATEYCEPLYKKTTEEIIGQKVKSFGRERTAAYVLSFNIAHTFEHYGNLVTYLRIKGLVPPSSETNR